jgi:hypothetical protein
MEKGTRVYVRTNPGSSIAPASANRDFVRLATVLGPHNPKWERGYSRIRFDSGHELVWSDSMLVPVEEGN